MSIIQKIKQFFKKLGQRAESTTSGSPIIKNTEGTHRSQKLAVEARRSEADINRDNEYQASERLKINKEENARLERIKADDLHKEQRRREQQRAEQERHREQQAEAARFEEIRAREWIDQQKNIEQQLAEQEQLKKNREKERRALEIERLNHIYSLYQNGPYVEYLREAERFRKEFGKNIKCDTCGEWEMELFNHRGQTYCERHIPTPRHTGNERKVTAGRHGSSRSYIKR